MCDKDVGTQFWLNDLGVILWLLQNMPLKQRGRWEEKEEGDGNKKEVVGKRGRRRYVCGCGNVCRGALIKEKVITLPTY